MCRCRDALRRLAIRKIDRREHPGVRRPFHTAKANARCEWTKAPRPANPCSKILCKSCRRFTTSRAPNKKTVYTPGLDPSGSTHRRLHNIARSTSGGPAHGPTAPARKSKSTVRRGARGRRIFYAVAGAVACSVQSRGCPHVLTLVSRHARFSHAQYESNATYRPRL